jgi:hypothetical protein
MQPLRFNGRWEPRRILEYFGTSRDESENLARVITAACVIEGIGRIAELATRIDYYAATALPRLEQMLRDKTFEPRQAVLAELCRQLFAAKREMPATRARAKNDVEAGRVDGLRHFDLQMLLHYTRMTVGSNEIKLQRNIVGFERALQVARMSPPLDYAELWLDRLTPSSPLQGIQLFAPRELGRVVVVYDDGRLAYDPGPFAQDPSSAG